MMTWLFRIQHKITSFHFALQFLLGFLVINQEIYYIVQASRVSDRCPRWESADCTCNMKVVVLNLRSFAHEIRIRLEDRLRQHVCQQYLRLPASLVIDASSAGSIFDEEQYVGDYESYGSQYQPSYYNRRYRKRRFKRQIRLGVPTNELFESAIAHVTANAFHQYVILGSTVRFQCWGRLDDWVDGSYVARMDWMHFNGEPITTPQVSIDAVAGTLTIPTVQLSDVDIYNCTMHRRTDEGIMETQTYSHQLSVISEPIFWLQMSVDYEAARCNHAEVKLIRNKLSSWVQQHICPQCEVHNDTVGCSSARSTNSEFPSTYNLVVSAIGLEIQMEKSISDRFYACPVSCLELLQTKIMEHVRDNMMKVFRLPIEVQGGGDKKLIHKVVPDSFEIELVMGCLAGFFLQYKLCFPCLPGTFSPYGSTECFPCSMSHYQPAPASAECLPCGHGLDTVGTGSVSYSQCHRQMLADTGKMANEAVHDMGVAAGVGAETALYLTLLLFVGLPILVLILAILIIICICCPNTGCGQCLRKYCCCCCRQSDTSYQPLSVEDKDERKDQRRHSKPTLHTSRPRDAERQAGRSSKVKPAASIQKKNPTGGVRPTVKMKRPPTPPPMPPTRY